VNVASIQFNRASGKLLINHRVCDLVVTVRSKSITVVVDGAVIEDFKIQDDEVRGSDEVREADDG
jgi:hypothetical protein